MPEEFYDEDFPSLRTLGFKRTSDPAYYNCIAYAAGDYKHRWWPGEYHPEWSMDYWPPGVPQEETLEAFFLAFATVGYERCDDGEWEEGFEKIAIYVRKGEVRHAALQLPDKTWRSKLASEEDIEHTLPGLEGPCYGNVAAYMKRARIASGQAEPSQ